MLHKQIYRVLILLFLFIFITGCNSSPSEKNRDDALTIYTSIYPIQYATEQIAGDLAQVKSIYPPGVDAHTYEPTSKDITNMADAQMFIYLGANMESFTNVAAEALKEQNITFVELAENKSLFSAIDNTSHQQNDDHKDHHGHDHEGENEHGEVEDGGHEHEEHEHGGVDPHIWLDPLRMIEMAEIIKNELVQLNPENEEIFEENFSNMKETMQTLDSDFTSTLETKTNKDIIVAHAAYGYWEARYGIHQIAVSGLSSGDEPSQKDLTAIAETAKEKKINYVLFEQTGTDRVTEIIQEHIGAQALYLHNLEVLTKEDKENKEDYISLMRKNLDVLDQATQ